MSNELNTADALKDPQEEIYQRYAADIEKDGWTAFATPDNAYAFASTYANETGIAVIASQEYGGRMIVRKESYKPKAFQW